MLKNIFLDLDDTILNFTAGEAKALSQTLREAGIEPTEAILDRYHIINTAHWELLEEGRLTRDEVLVQRFEQLFRELGVNHSGKAISERYEVLLSCQHDFMPGAEQLLKDLSSRYDLYLASNGAAAVQNPRLNDAGLRPYFKDIFISEEMGADKPSKAFFDACFAAIPGFRLEETVMVGDSLTSDIRGGLNAGLRTVWFNPTARNLVRTFVPAIPSALFRSCSPFWDLCGKAISFYSYSVGIDTSKISIPRRKAYSTV